MCHIEIVVNHPLQPLTNKVNFFLT